MGTDGSGLDWGALGVEGSGLRDVQEVELIGLIDGVDDRSQGEDVSRMTISDLRNLVEGYHLLRWQIWRTDLGEQSRVQF